MANANDVSLKTPLLFACKYKPTIKNVREEFDILINYDYHGADVYLRTKQHKLAALRLAAKQRHSGTVTSSLIKAGEIVKSLEVGELTPQHTRLLEGSLDVIEYVINNGVNLNCPDGIFPFAPLHLTIYRQRDDWFQLSINKGANVNDSSKGNSTTLHLPSILKCSRCTEALIKSGIKRNCRYDDQFTPLHIVTITSHLLNDEKSTEADALRYDNEDNLIVKMTCACHAIGKHDESVIRLLFFHGASVRLATKRGWTPLQYTIMIRRTINFENRTLLEFEVRDVEERDLELHYALKNKKETLAEVLINAGVNVNALIQQDKSPLHLALELACVYVCKLLARHGAQFDCKGKRCLYTLLYTIARNNDEDVINELREYFQKIPLILQAIDNLKDIEIKKAVMCLCGIVDACNENGCMPINFEIENDYADNSNILRMNRINVHDSEVYSKFACDRVLSGALQKLSYSCGAQTRKPQYVYDYLSMLTAVKLPLIKNYVTSRTQSLADLYSHNKLRTHFENCSEEVEKLKSYAIGTDVSLYDVLHMRPKRRRCYTKNLNLCKIKSEFQIYYQLILARYREDIIKTALMDTVQWAFYIITSVKLPIICVEDIFADLGVMNMIATIEAAEMIDCEITT